MNLIEVLKEIELDNQKNINFFNQNYFNTVYREKLDSDNDKVIFDLIKALFPDFLGEPSKSEDIKKDVNTLHNKLSNDTLIEFPLIIQRFIYKAYWDYLRDYQSALKLIEIDKKLWIQLKVKQSHIELKRSIDYLKEALEIAHKLNKQDIVQALTLFIENEIIQFNKESTDDLNLNVEVIDLIEVLFHCNNTLSLEIENLLNKLTSSQSEGIVKRSFQLLIDHYNKEKNKVKLTKTKEDYFDYLYESAQNNQNDQIKLYSLLDLNNICSELLVGSKLKIKRTELQKEIHILSKKLENSLPSFNFPMDVSLVFSLVFKNSFDQNMNLLIELTNSSEILQESEKLLNREENDLLAIIFPTIKLDREGRFVNPVNKYKKASREEELFIKVTEYINIHGLLLRYFLFILKEKYGVDYLINKLISNNPGIPDRRKNIFKTGLKLGFEGDFYASAHILLIQFEKLIRDILINLGVDPFKLNPNGDSAAHLLNHWLEKNPNLLNEYFGKDTVQLLRALLINKYGSNLRNDFAHALRDEDLE